MAEYEILLLVIALLALAASTSFVIRTRDALRTALSANEVKRSESHEKLIEELSKLVSPKVVHCGERAQVTNEAAEIIELAIKEKRIRDDRQRANETDKNADEDLEEESGEFITFYGAADLTGGDDPDAEDDPHAEEGEVATNPFVDRYRAAVKEATRMGIRLRRHVSLFEPSKLREGVALRYLIWLARQYELLVGDPSFHLVDNPRVPSWGASSATLITKEAILEIKANGAAAVAIYSASIAASIRESLREARAGASGTNVKTFEGGAPAHLARLADQIVQGSDEAHIDIQTVIDRAHAEQLAKWLSQQKR